MHAEIISIGDELTSGQRLDTNSQWLALQLGDLGVRTLYHTTVADDMDANVRVFQTALARAEIIVATGGLGPTADDLTRQSLAAATGRELKLDHAALADIEALFTKRGREMPQRNRVQAEFPAGSRVIPNPHGTAPGIDLLHTRADGTHSRIFCLPGVPAEMREMWAATVVPSIREFTGENGVIQHRVIRCFGVGESDLEAMLPDLIRRGRDPQVGITVSKATISLRITAKGADALACDQLIAPTTQIVRDCLGELIFGQGDEELEHAVLKLLGTHSASLATAEWGSEGQIARWLRAVPGNEISYAGGAVLGGLHSVGQFLAMKGSAAELTKEELTRRLAERCRELWHTDYGLAVGPAPASSTNLTQGTADTAQPPKIWLSLAGPEKTISLSQLFAGHPDLLIIRAAKQALNMLRLALVKRANREGNAE
ncbi:MAG: CinA family nicotinamide mononucleotide deamidase-related protein [Pirellulales bacterium]|nr:CinA family nicotinamide mononucleotide deamidase-related protein [Pirellulales bacterium]